MRNLIFKNLILTIIILLSNFGMAQVYKDNFAHTFSIVARDKVTGEMVVAVQSHWFAVGTSVSLEKLGVGVVATQSFINPAYGSKGFQLMEEGGSITETLEILIAKDEARDVRQVAMLDVHGDVSTFIGNNCIDFANEIIGNNFSVQANIMLDDKVVPAMSKAFRESGNSPLVERMINVHHAYQFMNKGDLAVEDNDMKTALKEYGAAQKIFPKNLEMKYWTAIALANNKNFDKALPIFKEVLKKIRTGDYRQKG